MWQFRRKDGLEGILLWWTQLNWWTLLSHEKNHFPKDKCFKFGNYNFILWLVWCSGQFFNLGLYINNTFHLVQKYARIFARGHYLLREANSFLRVYLKENCEFLGTDYVQGQIFKHIFAPNGGYCVYYSSNLFYNVHSFKNWGIFRYSVVLAVNIWSHDIVKPIVCQQKYLMDNNVLYSYHLKGFHDENETNKRTSKRLT